LVLVIPVHNERIVVAPPFSSAVIPSFPAVRSTAAMDRTGRYGCGRIRSIVSVLLFPNEIVAFPVFIFNVEKDNTDVSR